LICFLQTQFCVHIQFSQQHDGANSMYSCDFEVMNCSAFFNADLIWCDTCNSIRESKINTSAYGIVRFFSCARCSHRCTVFYVVLFFSYARCSLSSLLLDNGDLVCSAIRAYCEFSARKKLLMVNGVHGVSWLWSTSLHVHEAREGPSRKVTLRGRQGSGKLVAREFFPS